MPPALQEPARLGRSAWHGCAPTCMAVPRALCPGPCDHHALPNIQGPGDSDSGLQLCGRAHQPVRAQGPGTLPQPLSSRLAPRGSSRHPKLFACCRAPTAPHPLTQSQGPQLWPCLILGPCPSLAFADPRGVPPAAGSVPPHCSTWGVGVKRPWQLPRDVPGGSFPRPHPGRRPADNANSPRPQVGTDYSVWSGKEPLTAKEASPHAARHCPWPARHTLTWTSTRLWSRLPTGLPSFRALLPAPPWHPALTP